ncbi:MAG: hypothetical protein Q8933_10995 [Bacteroidota bacterium]|nr:hypothetical protein [Bacteroidota bacterium]MDP4193116.1 hypothetical protein [Bacteroidota bacterium]MDP4195978.1 hypothetical protein [Bacteroidota bacterium]
MKWHEMNWTDKVAELLVYSTAIIFCNLGIIFWQSISSIIHEQFEATSTFLAELASYIALFTYLAIIFLITLKTIRKINKFGS